MSVCRQNNHVENGLEASHRGTGQAHLPVIVRLSRSFRVDTHNGTVVERLTHIFEQLPTMETRHRITRLELPLCQIQGQDATRPAEVLTECPALEHLDLRGNCWLSTAARMT